MAANLIPTSSDIYLEVDGKKVAVVQSYTAQSTKSSTMVEAFGEREPVATIPGRAGMCWSPPESMPRMRPWQTGFISMTWRISVW